MAWGHPSVALCRALLSIVASVACKITIPSSLIFTGVFSSHLKGWWSLFFKCLEIFVSPCLMRPEMYVSSVSASLLRAGVRNSSLHQWSVLHSFFYANNCTRFLFFFFFLHITHMRFYVPQCLTGVVYFCFYVQNLEKSMINSCNLLWQICHYGCRHLQSSKRHSFIWVRNELHHAARLHQKRAGHEQMAHILPLLSSPRSVFTDLPT